MQLRGIVEAFSTPSSSHFFIKNDLGAATSLMVLLLWDCDRCVETRVYYLLSINYKKYSAKPHDLLPKRFDELSKYCTGTCSYSS